MKDFLEFDDLYKQIKQDLLEQHVRDTTASEDFVKCFRKLGIKIEMILAKSGKNLKDREIEEVKN